MLGWLVEEKDIKPHVPVCDKSWRDDGTLSSSEFQWNGKAKRIPLSGRSSLRNDWRPGKPPNWVTKDGTIIYRSRQFVCAICPRKGRCCLNTPPWKIHRSIHEEARDVAAS